MTKVKADEIKNVGSQEQPGDSGVAENPVRDEDDRYFQTTDAPVYRKVAQRIVVGIKPLIVRIGSSVDSELTGLISPGSKLQVVETRQEGNCLRALVLIDQANAEPQAQLVGCHHRHGPAPHLCAQRCRRNPGWRLVSGLSH